MSLDRYDLSAAYPPRAASGAVLLYISSTKYGPDWHSILHSHAFTELFYVLGGKGRFQIRDSLFSVGEGDLVIVEPNTEHTETSVDGSPFEYVVLGIDGFTMSAGLSQEEPYHLLRNAAPDILSQLRGILREMEEKAPGFKLVCQSWLNILLVQIVRRIGLEPDRDAPQPASRESAARQYIDSHYRENLSLDTISQAVHISKYHLAHLFSKEYGISPISYMLQLRLQECRELLRTTDYSVAQISRMTGFSSPSYFSQRFRRDQAITPAQYRQQFSKLHQKQSEESP